MNKLIKKDTEEKEMKQQEEPKEEKVTKEEQITKKENEKFKKVEKQPKKIKQEVEKEENPKNKKLLIGISIVSVFLIIMLFSTIFALININNEKIIKGISISGIDVSGLSKEEATTKISNIYQEKKEKEIAIQYQDYETTLNPTLMEVNYEVENAVNEAYAIGKSNNIFINNYNILFAWIQKKNIEVNMTLNEEVTNQTLVDIGVNLPGIMLDSSYAVEEDELIITKGKPGIVINTIELSSRVKTYLKNIEAKEEYIEIPVEQKEPEAIDIDKIHEEIYTEAKDAYYTKEPFTIYPEVQGVDFDVALAKEQLKEEKEEYIIKLKITKPKVTIDQIGSEAFPDQLATFTTRYDVSDVSRTTNLQIACQKINGKVILAGETFSYNKALGPRTTEAGYRNGKVYSGGEVVDGIGGGICQISSTLYNTVLMSNLQIVERKNHQFVTSYLPAGRDATVVYGLIDFKFKNTRKYPVKIVASAKNGIATVAMYGIKEENEYTFSFNTKTIASIPFSTKYEEDKTAPVGKERIRQKGANGLKVETYITKMLNGKVMSTTLLSKDTYDAMAKIIVKGTKEEQQQTTPTPEQEPTTPTPQPVEPNPTPESTPNIPSENTKPNNSDENNSNS